MDFEIGVNVPGARRPTSAQPGHAIAFPSLLGHPRLPPLTDPGHPRPGPSSDPTAGEARNVLSSLVVNPQWCVPSFQWCVPSTYLPRGSVKFVVYNLDNTGPVSESGIRVSVETLSLSTLPLCLLGLNLLPFSRVSEWKRGEVSTDEPRPLVENVRPLGVAGGLRLSSQRGSTTPLSLLFLPDSPGSVPTVGTGQREVQEGRW